MNKINTDSDIEKIVAQNERLRDDQVLNNSGGFVWQTTPVDMVRRFLILGVEGGTYYADEKTLTKDNAKNVVGLAKTDCKLLVDEVVGISESGRAAKQDPTLFALAIATITGDEQGRKYAWDSLPRVCRTASQLFSFIDYYTKLGGGWGRLARTSISNWYTSKNARDLIYQTTKYQQRNGWSHKDVVRLAHPKALNSDQNAVFKYLVKDDISFNGDFADVDSFNRLEAIIRAKSTTNVKDLVNLIQDFNLVREHIPTQFLNQPEVQAVLLEKMPITALIRNLGSFTSSGLFSPFSEAVTKAVSKLTNDKTIVDGRIHPFNVLVALKTYSSGRGVKGSLSWSPNNKIVDAMNSLYLKSFKSIQPTGKNFFLGVDVSSSMNGGTVLGSPHISPREAAAAMAMVTAKTEPNYLIKGFSHNLVDIPMSRATSVSEVAHIMSRIPMGSTDCSLPITYATKNNIPVDTFIIYTDNETNQGYGSIQPAQALNIYRQKTGRDAKLIVTAFTGTRFTIADPKDRGMLDIVGFDSAAPELIREFSLGNV